MAVNSGRDGELLHAEATDSTRRREVTQWQVEARQSWESLGLLLMTDSEREEGIRKLRDQASCLGIQLHLWAKPARDGTGSLALRECAMLAQEMVDEAIRSKPERPVSSFLPADV